MKQNSELNFLSSEESAEDSFIIFSSQSENKQQSSNELKLITFLNDKNKTLYFLNGYPNIKQLFIKYNTNLCSSTAVERLFSFAGFIHSPSRLKLPDNTFEKLVFIKGN